MKPELANQPVPPSDRGAIIVQTALVLLAMLAFAAFAVDYGVLWASRRQAQNAADAAALAGAVSFAFDSNDTTSSGAAYQAAERIVQSHRVWAEAPAYGFTLGTTNPPCPAGEPGPCIRVDVFRDLLHNNPLPTFFGKLVGVNSQGVRATATAISASANATDCLGPFSIADRFIDTNGDGLYNTGDIYNAPSGNDPGTGYSLADIGIAMQVKAATNTEDLGPGWFRLLDLFGGGSGGTSELNEVIRSCTADIKGIGDVLTDSTESGNAAGIKHGVEDLISTDAAAGWDSVAKRVINSCAETPAPCYRFPPGAKDPVVDDSLAFSPRILAISIFDPALYKTTGEIKIVNLLGFFIEGFDPADPSGKTIIGRLVTRPGVVSNTKGSTPGTASFLKQIQIIR